MSNVRRLSLCVLQNNLADKLRKCKSCLFRVVVKRGVGQCRRLLQATSLNAHPSHATAPVCWSVGLDYPLSKMATNAALGAGAVGSLLLPPRTQEPSAPDPKTPPYPPHVLLYAFGCTTSWWRRPFDLGCTRAVPIGMAQGTDTTFPHHLFDSAMRGPPVRVTNRIFLGDG